MDGCRENRERRYKYATEELTDIKDNLASFDKFIRDFCAQHNNELTQNEHESIIRIAKKILFFKYLSSGNFDKMQETYINGIISDLFYLISSILYNQKRYMQLNIRSFVEQILRMLTTRDNGESEQVTASVFEDFRNSFDKLYLTDDEYSLIRSVYRTACFSIHSSVYKSNDLARNIQECITISSNRGNKIILNNFLVILEIFIKLLIIKFPNKVNGSFHRKKSIMRILVKRDLVDLLFKLR